jgi:F-type H+-transporting ATPase subunit gamma
MASLKEIKDRIASVGGTLKITSAMKMVASAKLHKAQQAIGNMLPYEKRLHSMLIDLMGAVNMSAPASEEGSARLVSLSNQPDHTESEGAYSLMAQRQVHRVAIVAFASNSSLCGAFNSNAIREATAVINEYRASGLRDSDIVVYSVGRKMAEAMRKLGFPSPADFTKMSDSPSYEAASALAQELLDGFVSGRFDKVELVYNHYKSTSSQPTTRQTYLPLSLADATADLQAGKITDSASESDTNRGAEPVGAPVVRQGSPTTEDLIVEPSKEALIATLLPKVIRLRIFTTLLDSAAAEHAARTVAMQLATDNGNDLLQELTLEYNKGRQQKITSEILDLVGGSMQ